MFCVSHGDTGRLFGLLAALQSLSSVLSAALFNLWLYPATVELLPGTAILVAASLLLPPLALALYVPPTTHTRGLGQPVNTTVT